MINNFEQIQNLLTFNSDDIYYHLQIIRRGKDHPGLPSANRVIKSYFICSIESLNKLEEEIKKLCKLFQARAYINLTPKSIKKTSLLQLKYLSERIYNGDYKKIWKSWDSCAGEVKGEVPRWIVDIDDVKELDYVRIFIINQCEPRFIEPDNSYPIYSLNKDKVIAKVPTKSGYHLITKPFNLQQFKEKYPNIGVHKNNPTVLYIP